MTGDDVDEVFEAILPREEIDCLCVDCDTIVRQRMMNPRDVGANDGHCSRNAGWILSG
jgi:hypothetical protein